MIRYDTDKPLQTGKVEVRKPRPLGKVNLAFIGAGSYAQGSLLPHLPKKDPRTVCRGVMSNSGTTSKRAAERFGFEFATGDVREILDDESIDSVFIATRHDTHGDYVLEALRAGKHVFVEKPLAMSEEYLEAIRATARERPDLSLMVGFNRRFAPLTARLKEQLAGGPMSMLYRVNAGMIPEDHWIQDPAIGGGRIVGEACHFIDLMTYLCGALPVSVYSTALPDPLNLNDTVSIQVTFEDGSIGTVAYFANGAKALGKEYLEVYQSGFTGILRDFRQLTLYGSGKPEVHRLRTLDKGQASMIRAFLDSLRTGRSSLISFDELYSVTLATFAAERSLREGQRIDLRSNATCADRAADGEKHAAD
jgi:predicted dehydrogenase